MGCPLFSTRMRKRAAERGATEEEIVETVRMGERFPAKRGRTAFRRNLAIEYV
ncbi:MAG: hypothetical protein WB500_04315 [Rhodoplanes sp.]